MKKIYVIGLLGLGLLGSCSNEDTPVDARPQKGNYTIEATIGDAQTRTSVDGEFGVQWSKEDQIGVYGKATATNVAFTLEGDGGTANGQFTGEFSDTPTHAYYPYSADASISEKKLTMKLPTAYNYTGDSNGPMAGKYADGGIVFKHLCGLLKVTVNSIPATAAKFVLEGGTALAGQASVADITTTDAVLALSQTESEVSKSITVSLSEKAVTNKAFYFPLPVGTYENLKVSLQDAAGNVLYEKTASSVGITRAKAVDMPMLDASIACLKEIAKNGGTYTLASDMIFAEPLVVSSTMTLDLNGHSIKPANTGLTQVLNTKDALVLVRRGAHLTINDSSNGAGNGNGTGSNGADNGNGTGSNSTGSIDCNNITSIYAAVKLTDTNDEQDENLKKQAASLTVNNGNFIGSRYAITGNGNRHNTAITIHGGTFSGTEADAIGIYHPQEGTLTMDGGKIIGNTGIEMRAGTLTVSNGAIAGTATELKKGANGGGTTIIGAAVAVSQHVTNKVLKVNISGGTLTGLYALYEEDLQDASTDGISMEVTGGNLEGDVYSENCPSFIKGGTFSNPSALNYAASNATFGITLNKNIQVTKEFRLNAEGAAATVNLNGHDLVNSTETVSDNYGNTRIFIVSKGTLDITGSGNVKCDASQTDKEDGYRIAVEAQESGVVNIRGGSYYNTQKKETQIDLIYAIGKGKINIYGGTFESGKYGTPDTEEGKYWVLNIHNGSKEKASMKVYGGTFVNFNPTSPNMDDIESYTAEGYEVTRDGSVYTNAHKVVDGRKEYIVRQKAGQP